MIKQAIGDPVAAIALIDNGLFSDFLQVPELQTRLPTSRESPEGVQLSATGFKCFEPIDMSAWSNVSGYYLPPLRASHPSGTQRSLETISRCRTRTRVWRS